MLWSSSECILKTLLFLEQRPGYTNAGLSLLLAQAPLCDVFALVGHQFLQPLISSSSPSPGAPALHHPQPIHRSAQAGPCLSYHREQLNTEFQSRQGGVEAVNSLMTSSPHCGDEHRTQEEFLVWECTWLGHVQFFIHQHPQILPI